MLIICDETNVGSPCIDLIRPLCVGSIASQMCKACSQEEQLAIGYSVFVIVPVVEGKDLPFQASVTAFGVPTYDLSIENVLRELQPGARCGGRQLCFMRRQTCKAPETLVIISKKFGLVGRHEGIEIAKLVLEACRNTRVILRVIGKTIVVDQCVKDQAGLPPIVWVREQPGGEIFFQSFIIKSNNTAC